MLCFALFGSLRVADDDFAGFLNTTFRVRYMELLTKSQSQNPNNTSRELTKLKSLLSTEELQSESPSSPLPLLSLSLPSPHYALTHTRERERESRSDNRLPRTDHKLSIPSPLPFDSFRGRMRWDGERRPVALQVREPLGAEAQAPRRHLSKGGQPTVYPRALLRKLQGNGGGGSN